MVPGAMVKGMGGAMDLVNGVGRVIVLMDDVTKTGDAKLVAACDLPLTGRGVVGRVITDLGVFDWPAPLSRLSSWRRGWSTPTWWRKRLRPLWIG
jgi:3-oxoacid CoA-transferase B subunit